MMAAVVCEAGITVPGQSDCFMTITEMAGMEQPYNGDRELTQANQLTSLFIYNRIDWLMNF